MGYIEIDQTPTRSYLCRARRVNVYMVKFHRALIRTGNGRLPVWNYGSEQTVIVKVIMLFLWKMPINNEIGDFDIRNGKEIHDATANLDNYRGDKSIKRFQLGYIPYSMIFRPLPGICRNWSLCIRLAGMRFHLTIALREMAKMGSS